MLDMGFIHDVRKIVGFCREARQTPLFSATMPPSIAKLAHDILHDKRAVLTDLLKGPAVGQVIVFTRTKRSAERPGNRRWKRSRHRRPNSTAPAVAKSHAVRRQPEALI